MSRVVDEAASNEFLSRPRFCDGVYAHPEIWGFEFKKFTDMARWMILGKRAAVPPVKELDEKLPILIPDPEKINEFHNSPENRENVQSVWIGHSTFLLQMEGCNILTDPVFYQRCSPISFMGPKRYRNPAISLEDLPHIDAVVVSHDHYDHLDVTTIKYLANNSPETVYYAGKGMRNWFKGCGIPDEKIHDLSWWESVEHSPELKMVFTPCQHWTKRNLTDSCRSLWGSWSIIGQHNKVFFAGDTGYCPGFKEIGETFGPFDIGLIPIGAYCPREIMQPQHVDPEEAVRIHLDLGCKVSIGMHWGTFVLTDENIYEPPQKLEEAKIKLQVSANEFIAVSHGQRIVWLHGQDITEQKE